MTAPMRTPRNSGWRIFRWPLAIGIASLAGLIGALVGEGWVDAVSTLLLGAAVVLVAVFLAI